MTPAGRAARLPLARWRLHQDGGVLIGRLDDPPSNYASAECVSELDQITRAVDRDPTVRAVVLTGTGDLFLSHADPGQIEELAQVPTPQVPFVVAKAMTRLNHGLMRVPAIRRAALRSTGQGAGIAWAALVKQSMIRMNRSSAVYLAAINGPALGGGLEIALACDLRIASDARCVRLGMIEILAGLIPGGGATYRLPRLVGGAAAVELMLEGRPVAASEAAAIGLVHRVVPADRLYDEAMATAHRLSRRSPDAVAALKRALYRAPSRGLGPGYDHEMACMVGAMADPHRHATALAFRADHDRLGDSPFVADAAAWLDGTRVPREVPRP